MFFKYLETKLFAVWEQSPACPRPNFMIHTSNVMEIWLRTPTRSQAGAVQNKQEQEPVSVCRDVPELRTFSASQRATAAMGHNCISSAESPTHLLALLTWISRFMSIFPSYKGKKSKGIFTVLLVSTSSFRNKSVIAIKAVRKKVVTDELGRFCSWQERKSWGLPT